MEVPRRNVNRLAEMADEVAADVSRAALPPVQKRDTTLDAAEGQARAQRGAELASVARGGEMLRLRLPRIVFHWQNRNDPAGTRSDRATIQALTIRRASA